MKIEKLPPFLSPSSLVDFEDRPNKAYAERLVFDPEPRDPQSLPAAAGSAWDFSIKKHLLETTLAHKKEVVKERLVNVPWRQKHLVDKDLEEILLGQIEPQNLEEVAAVGERLKDVYVSSPIFKDTVFTDIENRQVFELRLKIRGVQWDALVYGILDAVKAVPNGEDPLDFKLSGYNSKHSKSPKPGFKRCFDQDMHDLGSHASYTDDTKDFSEIDFAWATQGCTYGWILGKKLFEPFSFTIHAMFLQKTGLRICEYVGQITSDFQKQVALRYINVWKQLHAGSYIQRVAPTRLLADFCCASERKIFW